MGRQIGFRVVSQIQFFAQPEEFFDGAVVHTAVAGFVAEQQFQRLFVAGDFGVGHGDLLHCCDVDFFAALGFMFVEIDLLVVHLQFERGGFDHPDPLLTPFRGYHFVDEVGFHSVPGLEFVQVHLE
ncbi:MAG: hypothetical protein ABJF23_33110 [Bryobacteraceae bacterium]